MRWVGRMAAAAVLAIAAAIVTWRHRKLVDRFRRKVGYVPNLAVPRTFREKMQWRKIFDRNPRFARLQDKMSAKDSVAALVPDQLMPKVTWSGTDAATMPPSAVSRPCFVKTTHGSGFNIAVPDPATCDIDAVRIQAAGLLASRYGDGVLAEWAYGEIVPRVFVEERIRTAAGTAPTEYKVTVVNGAPLLITAVVPGDPDRHAYYTPAWERLPVLIGKGNSAGDVPAPRCLAHMLATAVAVAQDLDMVRVDFYDVDGIDYFGECTVYSVSGLLPIRPREFDRRWGEAWNLRKAHFFRAPIESRVLQVYRWALATWLEPAGR